MRYNVFTRTWWKVNKSWPGGLEPKAGRRTNIGTAYSAEEAREMCKEWNSRNKPGRLDRRAEFEQE